MSCTFLDYIWGGLVSASVSSMLVMSVHWAVSVTLTSRFSARALKWYFHVQYSVLAAAVLAGFAIAFFASPDLQAGCFEKFAAQIQGFSITRVLAGLWIVGVVGLLAVDVVRSLKLRRWIGQQAVASEIESGHVRVRVSTLNPSPFVFGLLKYTIVIPEPLFSDKRQLSHVMAHELAHAYDHDGVWMLIERACRTLLFFNPMMHLLNRRYRLTVERAADEVALRNGGFGRGEYASTLIAVAEMIRTFRDQSAPSRLNMSRCYADLRLRIESLKAERKSPILGMALLLGGSLSLSVGLAWAQSYIEIQKPKGGQCRQIEHEKTIESWLRIEAEPAPLTCEEK